MKETAREKKARKMREWTRTPEGRVIVAQRNAELRAAVKGNGFDERLLRHNVRHSFGVLAERSCYKHNGRICFT